MLRRLLYPLARVLANYCWVGRTEFVVNRSKHQAASDRYILVGSVQDVEIQVKSGGGYEITKQGATVLLLTDVEFGRARARANKNLEDIPRGLMEHVGEQE